MSLVLANIDIDNSTISVGFRWISLDRPDPTKSNEIQRDRISLDFVGFCWILLDCYAGGAVTLNICFSNSVFVVLLDAGDRVQC